ILIIALISLGMQFREIPQSHLAIILLLFIFSVSALVVFASFAIKYSNAQEDITTTTMFGAAACGVGISIILALVATAHCNTLLLGLAPFASLPLAFGFLTFLVWKETTPSVIP